MKNSIKQFFLVAISIALIGVAVNMFLGPHNIAAGGVSGLGILAETALGIDRASVVFVFNVALLILAFIFLGKAVFIRTALGSLLLPISLAIIPTYMVTEDRLLSVIFGSAIFAVGVAILYRIEASSGGTTIPPLIFKKYFNLNTSIGLFLSDAIIVLFNLFVFGTEEFLLAIFSIAITSAIMSYIEMGLNRKIAVMIMSDNHIDDIKNGLLEKIKLGVTVFSVTGGYTADNKQMLMIVLESRDYPSVLKLVDEIDKKSFVITYSVAEAHGLVSYHTIE